MRSVLTYHLLAKFLKIGPKDLETFLDLCRTDATVLNTPLTELLPAVDRHPRVADHDLVEFVRKRRAVRREAPVSVMIHNRLGFLVLDRGLERKGYRYSTDPRQAACVLREKC